MQNQPDPRALAALPDAELLEAVQRQTFRFFWEGGHPVSGLALDRSGRDAEPDAHMVTVGGSGFCILALIVAAERGWEPRAAVLERLETIVAFLSRAPRYHGVFAHFMNGRTGATIPLFQNDDGGDLVETGMLFMGLLTARQYFDRDTAEEAMIRDRITAMWEAVEWDWHTQGGQDVLYWLWSPDKGWVLNQEIRGWNECLLTYVLAASAPRHAIDPSVYTRGFAGGQHFLNGKSYYGINLPLGPPFGGPLFFCHYSFCGLDPRGLMDQYADYWEQCVGHVTINRAHCIENPDGHKGYGDSCWGLTASDDPHGYSVHAPDSDNGTISPTAAISSLPFAPSEVLALMRHLLEVHGEKVWGRYGFVDAFCEDKDWFADTFLAIDQGPMIAMIENHRSGLLWKLFMSIPEVQTGLRRLDFVSPHLGPSTQR
jgi:hypothetical protein